MQNYTKLNQVLDEVTLELGRATGKFPQYPTDPLHAIAILQEEVGELTKAVLQATYEPEKGSRAHIKEEALQVAAMAIRFLLSTDEYIHQKSEQHFQPTLDPAEKHIDDIAVDNLANAMKLKLAKKRAESFSGWEKTNPHFLSKLLLEHTRKGDPVDVANFCAFLYEQGKKIEA